MQAKHQPPLENSFDIVVKVAERCNLACPHCYYFFKEFDGTGKAAFITERTVEELPRFLRRSLDTLNVQHFNVVFHGGEPLLLKKARFDDLCQRLRAGLEGHAGLSLGMQTNGVLIDNEWIEIFAKHDVRVGVSIDGPPELHDLRRPDKRGKGSYAGAARGLELLQDAVRRRQLGSVGAMCTVHPTDNSEQLLTHMIDSST